MVICAAVHCKGVSPLCLYSTSRDPLIYTLITHTYTYCICLKHKKGKRCICNNDINMIYIYSDLCLKITFKILSCKNNLNCKQICFSVTQIMITSVAFLPSRQCEQFTVHQLLPASGRFSHV